MANLTRGERFLECQRNNFVVLILDKEAFHLLPFILNMLHHFCNLYSAHNRVCAGNGRDNIAGHVLNFVESLLFYAEAMHSEVGSTCDKVNNVVVVLLKCDHSVFQFLLGQSVERFSK